MGEVDPAGTGFEATTRDAGEEGTGDIGRYPGTGGGEVVGDEAEWSAVARTTDEGRSVAEAATDDDESSDPPSSTAP